MGKANASIHPATPLARESTPPVDSGGDTWAVGLPVVTFEELVEERVEACVDGDTGAGETEVEISTETDVNVEVRVDVVVSGRGSSSGSLKVEVDVVVRTEVTSAVMVEVRPPMVALTELK